MFVFVMLSCLFVPCSLVVTCWERPDHMVLLHDMISCVFVTFQYGVLGQMWYLFVSITDLFLLILLRMCHQMSNIVSEKGTA